MNSTRLGLYETVYNLNWTKVSKSNSNNDNKNSKNDDDQQLQNSPILCLIWGGVSGVCGSIVGCPFYLIKTQMQSQSYGKYAVGYQHEHKNTFNGLQTVYKEQGIKGLWRGVSAMVPRTAVGSSVQLTTFTLCKDVFHEIEVRQI